MNVMVIPEDFRKDQYMLQPIIYAMMSALGQRHAKVRVCMDPLLGGVTEALKWERIKDIIERYKWSVNLFVLCVDRDGDEGRRGSLDHLENQARGILSGDKFFLSENAWQEIEVWVLAGHRLPSEWRWDDIRAEIDPKERYFLPFVRMRGLMEGPGEGRKTLAIEAAANYSRICQLCREDIGNLEDRVRNWICS